MRIYVSVSEVRVWAYIAVGLLLWVLVTSALMECWLMAMFKKKKGGRGILSFF